MLQYNKTTICLHVFRSPAVDNHADGKHQQSKSRSSSGPAEDEISEAARTGRREIRRDFSHQTSRHFRRRGEKSAIILIVIVLTFLVCHTFRLVIKAYEVTYPSGSTSEHHVYCHKLGRYVYIDQENGY